MLCRLQKHFITKLGLHCLVPSKVKCLAQNVPNGKALAYVREINSNQLHQFNLSWF
jgi:hypothetical protein